MKVKWNEGWYYYICSDCQAAICAIISHTSENYNNNTISLIRDNLIETSLRISSIKMIYCPGHKGMCENEIADSLAKKGQKKLGTCHVKWQLKKK